MKKLIIGLLLVKCFNVHAIGGVCSNVLSESGLSGRGVVIIRQKRDDVNSDELFGSGVLLSSNLILTAAHNMENSAKYVYYAVKTNNYRAQRHQIHPREDSLARKFTEKDVGIPNDYREKGGQGIYYDNAIVQLKNSFSNMSKIKILDPKEDLNSFEYIYISGFSKSGLYKSDYGVFRYVPMSYDKNKTELLKPDHLYLVPNQYNGRAFGADSGGGIFVRKNGEFYLVGNLVRTDNSTGAVFGTDLRYTKGQL
ncbi:trypsin-like serine protease [Bdellovibrionales bacterium]|nr:trypsin-like serine protease [Bdellovibrionales bacterium]